MSDKKKKHHGTDEEPMSAEQTQTTAPEAPAAEAPQSAPQQPIQQPPQQQQAVNPLSEALAAAQAEAEDNKRKWYLVSAEYENYRKRTANIRSQSYAEGRADVVVKLFPIADNLDRALASCADDNTRHGIEMILKSFEKLLEEEHISVIYPLGEEFNADKSEAIMAVEPQAGDRSGTVKQVYLKGYEQNGKVLRFAQVVVVK